MPKITLQFSYKSGIGSTLICWRDWSEYAHVDAILPDGRLLGAKGDGVKIRDRYPVKRLLVLSVEVTQEQHDLFYQFLTEQLGKPYDYTGVFGFISNRDWEEDDKWFCSELQMAAFKRAGIDMLKTDYLNRITARDLQISPMWA